MEFEILKWIVVTLIGVAGYFLKRNIDQLDKQLTDMKQEQHGISQNIQQIRSDYLHKNDFKEFKLELRTWIDELKADIRDRRG